jgi:hypothetical protein
MLQAQVGRAAARAAEQAVLLENVGAQAFDAIADMRRDSQGSELLSRAHHLRALVLHGMAVLAQLQCEAGSLEAMASLADCMDES